MIKKEVTANDLVQVERMNGFWIKLAGGLLLAGIAAVISLIMGINVSVIKIESDISYMKSSLSDSNTRMAAIENSSLRTEDLEQAVILFDLKLENMQQQIDKIVVELKK